MASQFEYDEARRYFKSDQTRQWAAYVAGVFPGPDARVGTRFDQGARLLISSRVPEGKGVSSSAALEVATMSAVAAAFDIEIAPREIALLCQRVENLGCWSALRCDGPDECDLWRSESTAGDGLPAGGITRNDLSCLKISQCGDLIQERAILLAAAITAQCEREHSWATGSLPTSPD